MSLFLFGFNNYFVFLFSKTYRTTRRLRTRLRTTEQSIVASSDINLIIMLTYSQLK